MSAREAVGAPPRLTLLLGGVRSGKSARALQLAGTYQGDGRVLFVATGEALDDEMQRRIAAHRAERPPSWDTLEAPRDLGRLLEDTLVERDGKYAVVVIDCLTLWVSNIVCALTDGDDAETVAERLARGLLDVWSRRPQGRERWIVVSNEVGLGIVPPTLLGRRYRDALGRVNQLVAATADDVTLMVAGIALPIKRDGGSRW